MAILDRALAALKRFFIVAGIAIAFTIGLIGAIVLSLHSSETTVPDIVGKDRTAAENAISEAGLNFRVRATRPAGDTRPDTVLIQVPASGVVVKVGQTVAVDLSRPAREGETPAAASTPEAEKTPENNNDRPANNATEDKPRRPRNTNKNGNANENLNATNNRNTNANRNRNSGVSNSTTNREGNHNGNSAGTSANNGNSNNRRANGNANRANANSNGNRRRPTVSPTP